MNLKSASLMLAAGAMLMACGDTVTNINDEAKEKGNITLRVIDNHSSAAIDSAVVYSVMDEEEGLTDELGISTWTKNAIGDYVFKISKDGYATMLTTVTVAETGKGDVARVPDIVTPIAMYKTGVAAKGTVLYKDESGDSKGVDGATVYAKLPSQFVPSEISTKTDKSGVYTFEDLPEGVVISLSVGQKTIDSKKYADVTGTKIGGETYRAGDMINVGAISLTEVAGEVLLLSSNAKDLGVDKELKLTFSTALKKDSVNIAHWSVEQGRTSALFTVSLSEDGKTVSIKSYSGKWEKGATYTATGIVYSKEGAYKKVTVSFTPGSSAAKVVENVTDLKVAYDDPDDLYYYVLTWTAPKEEPAGYNVYYKTTSMANFVMYSDYSAAYGSALSPIQIRTSFISLEKEDTDIQFIVLPYNSNGVEAPLASAKAAKLTISK